MAGVTSHLLLLVYPTFYVLLAMAALGQLAAVFSGLQAAAYAMERQAVLEAFAPILKAWVRYQESVFGPAYKFVPNPTHVLLVALMLAVIAHGR